MVTASCRWDSESRLVSFQGRPESPGGEGSWEWEGRVGGGKQMVVRPVQHISRHHKGPAIPADPGYQSTPAQQDTC